jgi:hypothetical protein
MLHSSCAGDTTGSVGCRTLRHAAQVTEHKSSFHRAEETSMMHSSCAGDTTGSAGCRTLPDRPHRLPKIWVLSSELRCNENPIYVQYSFSENCAASVPISTFMCLWAIYIFPGYVHILSCSRIGTLIMGIDKSLTDTWMWKLGLWLSQFLFW